VFVAFNDDAELRQLFVSEVQERAERLVAGARQMADGPIDRDVAHDLYREGHTIKGTARMMGFVALSDAGRLLEETWKGVVDGDVRQSTALGESLAWLSEALLPSIDADPELGPAALADAIRAVRRALGGEDPEPPAGGVPEGVAAIEASVREGSDLGGLVGTLDSTAFGEKVRVDAAGLYRLINGLCSLRVDADAMGGLLSGLTADIDGGDPACERLSVLSASAASIQKAILDLQGQAVDLAAVPLSEITNTLPQLVRYLARRADKEVRFELVGDEHAVDRQVLDTLGDSLRQLLVNAIEHGIEPVSERLSAGKPPTATLAMRARVVDHKLEVVVTDDGRGVDWAAVRRGAIRRGLLPPGQDADVTALKALLFSSNFSTALPGELVGDGNGLAELAAAVESLHGTLSFETTEGEGTTVRLVVPTSRALQDAVLVVAGGQTWGLPEIAVLDRVPHPADGGTAMAWRDTEIPLRSFAEAVGLGESRPQTRVLVVTSASGPVGFTVASELGSRQVAARELGPVLGGAPHLTGAALLGGGDVVLLVDPARLAERSPVADRGPKHRVLVVDDSRGARQIIGSALGSAGYLVDLAASAGEALAIVADREFDAIVVDYVLPTMDGATLVGRMRALGIEAPIVVLSGLATTRDKERVIAAGADAYFDKDDVRKGALSSAIGDLIEARADG
jgi:two-component system chemotaxis sensor kinase CheA